MAARVRGPPIVRTMTSEQPVEGGLDEPEELEPDQGTLALAGPEDAHGRADWERAAAAVLRKARRLGDDDPDDAGLGRADPHHARRPRGPAARHARPGRRARHLRSAPPAPAAGTSVRRPPTASRRWSTSTTARPRCWSTAAPTWPRCSTACMLDLAPVVLDRATAAQARSFLDGARRRRPRPTAPTWAPTPPATTWSRSPDSPARPGCSRRSSTRRRCTSRVRPTCRRSAGRSRRSRRTSGGSTAAGFSVTEAAGLVELRLAATDEQFVDDRQAPGGPPAVEPDARAERGRAGRRCGSTRSPAGR